MQALFAALVAFRLLPEGFANRDLRETVAPLMGLSVADYHRNRTTYDLRRLRLRGLIERIPRTRRYRVTENGLRTALCYHRTHARVMRSAIAVSFDPRRVRPASAVCSTPSITRSTASGRAANSPRDSQPDCKLQLCSRNLAIARVDSRTNVPMWGDDFCDRP